MQQRKQQERRAKRREGEVFFARRFDSGRGAFDPRQARLNREARERIAGNRRKR